MADDQHIDNSEWIVSLLGIGNTVGRIVVGYISDKPWVNRLTAYNLTLIVGGAGKNNFLFLKHLAILLFLEITKNINVSFLQLLQLLGPVILSYYFLFTEYFMGSHLEPWPPYYRLLL